MHKEYMKCIKKEGGNSLGIAAHFSCFALVSFEGRQ